MIIPAFTAQRDDRSVTHVMKMAVIQLVVAIILSLLATCGKCVHVLLGDPVTFPETGNCRTDEPAKLHRVGEHSTLSLVAQREQGVWSPVWDYKDRVNRGASFAFNSTVYTDKGLYALGCGSREERTYLHVVIGFEASVYEGEPAKLMCYISGQHVDSIRWEKGQKTLLELNLSSGEIYPPGLDGKLSLSPDGKVGDYSLIFNQVLLEDQGDYFCSAHANGARERWGEPAAVKLRVTRKNPDPTGTRPTRTPTKSVTKEEQMGTWAIVVITAAVVFLIGVPSSILLGWYLKSRRAPHGSGGGRYVCGATVSLLVAPLKPMSALCCQPKSKDNQI